MITTPIRALNTHKTDFNPMHANLHMNAICRSGGRNAVASSAYRSGTSVVACAAYRSGEKIKDERYEKTHDYTKKHNVLHSEIITPVDAPEWMKNREQLWNSVEAGEKRKDAQLAKEVILVLPRNLDIEQHKDVVREFINNNLTSRGLVADYAIHSPDASDGGKNPHAHIMFTLRPVDGDGFGKKQTGYNDGGLDGRETLEKMRFSYQDILNKTSEKTDSNVRFDLRNLKEKGIDREPQPKIGKKVTHMEKRGYKTDWGKECRQKIHDNYNRPIQQYIEKTNSSLLENMRADVANKYYEVMFDYENKDNQNHLER